MERLRFAPCHASWLNYANELSHSPPHAAHAWNSLTGSQYVLPTPSALSQSTVVSNEHDVCAYQLSISLLPTLPVYYVE